MIRYLLGQIWNYYIIISSTHYWRINLAPPPLCNLFPFSWYNLRLLIISKADTRILNLTFDSKNSHFKYDRRFYSYPICAKSQR